MNLPHLIDEYERATQVLLDAAFSVAPRDLDRHVEGAWSARQVIHHMADAETNSYVRLRRLLAEAPGTVIQGYDEAAWATCDELGYTDLAVEHPLRVFDAVRAASLDVLRRIGPQDLAREGVHTESGPYTLEAWLETYVRHPLEHAAQLLEAARA